MIQRPVCVTQRHAFQSTYKVGFRSDGTIVGLDLALFCNAGANGHTRVACAPPHLSMSARRMEL